LTDGGGAHPQALAESGGTDRRRWDEAILTRLRRAEIFDRPIGVPEFLEQLERDSNRALAPGKRGRKAKSGVSP